MGRIRLNENAELVVQVRAGLKERGGYCPCRREIKEEYRCMCQEFKDQIADPEFEGYCHCMLYYKVRSNKIHKREEEIYGTRKAFKAL